MTGASVSIEVPLDRLSVERARVVRLFDRPRLAVADEFLQREVAKRMFERLTTVRLDVARVADVGCGSGPDLLELGRRFPDASVCGVDLALARLRRIALPKPRGFARWTAKNMTPAVVQADFESLPFAGQRFDVLWSNLALHWTAAPHRVLPDWSRVLRTGGLVAFSVFGPDTLREVRSAFAAVDDDSHVLSFTDMHDYGDMLVDAGFTAPVVDAERLTLTYPRAESLWRDVRALGGLPSRGNARLQGLRGRRYGDALTHALESTRGADGAFQLTFELIYAHAWKAAPRQTRDGEAIVRFERR